MLYAPFQFFVSCGTSYALFVFGDLHKGIFRPVTAGSKPLDVMNKGLQKAEN
jgi:hypothetical protein